MMPLNVNVCSFDNMRAGQWAFSNVEKTRRRLPLINAETLRHHGEGVGVRGRAMMRIVHVFV